MYIIPCRLKRPEPADDQSIYYFNRACNYTAHETACPKERAIAPPAGLRMVAGDSSRRFAGFPRCISR